MSGNRSYNYSQQWYLLSFKQQLLGRQMSFYTLILIFILIHFSLIQSLKEILYSINTYFGFLDIQKFTS